MSQRECAGFTEPISPVSTGTPFTIPPRCQRTACVRPICAFVPSGLRPVHDVPFGARLPPMASLTAGVGHKENALALVRRSDNVGRKTNRPDGVVFCFQVSGSNVEPPKRRRNLFTKDNWRAALADEVVESGPEVPRVIEPAAFACRAERLAREGSGPDRSVVRPSGKSQGVGPDTDPGEEVALRVSSEVIWAYVLYAALVHIAGGDVTGGDQVPQPLDGVRLDFVVVGAAHACFRRGGLETYMTSRCWAQ